MLGGAVGANDAKLHVEIEPELRCSLSFTVEGELVVRMQIATQPFPAASLFVRLKIACHRSLV